MRIVADENISHAYDAFSGFGQVDLYPGREITNKILKDADVLITRSVTYVNKDLLDNTKVKFVGTATIGWDHIDIEYLKKNNIYFTSAAGCNSDAVTEYVFTSLFHLTAKHKISIAGKKLGIIGAGNIGGRVARIASAIGFEVILNDPPLARKTGNRKYLPLNAIYDCDIITLHVPMNLVGEDKTHHLLNSENLKYLRKGSFLINSSRGAVIDNLALVKFIKEKKSHTVLDVWENEPHLDPELLKLAEIATPHIAGYSIEGKINGTRIIYDQLCRFIGYNPGWNYLPTGEGHFDGLKIPGKGSFEEKIDSVLSQVYNIKRDDTEMRQSLEMSAGKIPAYFDLLRKNYPLRKEFTNYNIINKDIDHKTADALSALGFK